jgi:hypothetical protein
MLSSENVRMSLIGNFSPALVLDKTGSIIELNQMQTVMIHHQVRHRHHHQRHRHHLHHHQIQTVIMAIILNIDRKRRGNMIQQAGEMTRKSRNAIGTRNPARRAKRSQYQRESK